MGYFSNGTEGESYQADYCSRCVVDERGCAVWFLHMMHNYAECNKADSFLHVLIPRSKDKLGNERCTMFVEKPQAGAALFPTHCDRCEMPYHGGACSGVPQPGEQKA